MCPLFKVRAHPGPVCACLAVLAVLAAQKVPPLNRCLHGAWCRRLVRQRPPRWRAGLDGDPLWALAGGRQSRPLPCSESAFGYPGTMTVGCIAFNCLQSVVGGSLWRLLRTSVLGEVWAGGSWEGGPTVCVVACNSSCILVARGHTEASLSPRSQRPRQRCVTGHQLLRGLGLEGCACAPVCTSVCVCASVCVRVCGAHRCPSCCPSTGLPSPVDMHSPCASHLRPRGAGSEGWRLRQSTAIKTWMATLRKG